MNDDDRVESSSDWATDPAGFPVLGPDLLGFDADDERDDDVTDADGEFVSALFAAALRDEPAGGRSPLAIMAAARVSTNDGAEVRRIVERERRSAKIRRWVGGAVAAAAVVGFAAVVVPNLGSSGDSTSSMADSGTTAAASTVAAAGEASDGGAAPGADEAGVAGGGRAESATGPAAELPAASAAEESSATSSAVPPEAPAPMSTAATSQTTAAESPASPESAPTLQAGASSGCAAPALSEPALVAARAALGLPAGTPVETVTVACDGGVVGAAAFPAAGVQVVVASPGAACADGQCLIGTSGTTTDTADDRAKQLSLASGSSFVVVAGPMPDTVDVEKSAAGTTLQQVADRVLAALG